MTESGSLPVATSVVDDVIAAVDDSCRRHGIAALDDFLSSCRRFSAEKTLNIAVLGRFKAGKSSFLNHLLGTSLLPVGVIPVTSAVTEIQWGARERAEVTFADGRREWIPATRIGEFISESANPENSKGVDRVRLELPSMTRYRGIRFVDTPGLESVFGHNTDASLEWLPNVGLALVAVGVDPPLSQHDIELIRELNRYTPNISLLLTKVDVLDVQERNEVREFVQKQLARYWRDAVPVFQYSVKPGFEPLRAELDASLVSRVPAHAEQQHTAILMHRLESLVGECASCLTVALQAAEQTDFEREELRRRILGQRAALDDIRLSLQLLVRHAMGTSRSTFQTLLQIDEAPLRRKLLAGLDQVFPAWTRSLGFALERFEDWLNAELTREIGELSGRHRGDFLEPGGRVGRQLSKALQDFRNRMSERGLETLGVPLRTTEIDLQAAEPKSPDVRVGKVFDRNWELLSWLIPMLLVKPIVLAHFRRKVEEAIVTNLSRLASQWQDVLNASLGSLEKEALRRMDGLIGTIDRLLASAGEEAPRISAEMEQLEGLRQRLITALPKTAA